MLALISFLAIVNYLGVAKGMLLNNFFAAAKLILLMLFTVGGLAALLIYPAIPLTPDAVSSHASDWFEALILIVYAMAVSNQHSSLLGKHVIHAKMLQSHSVSPY